MIRSSIYSGVKWKPINKTAAHGMSGHIEKLVSLADNPTPELGRLRTALLPKKDPLWRTEVREMSILDYEENGPAVVA